MLRAQEARVKHALSFAMTFAMMISMVAALGGCGEETPAAASEPEAVTPVEVTQAVAVPEAPDELTTLRARVTELESQLAACQTAAAPAPSGTETVAIPAGADTPEATTPTAQTARPDAGARARRARDPSLLDTILGPDGRRRADDDTIRIPNPANVLLGE
jgi:hypothetical protein